MARSRRNNKENIPECKNKPINNYYKVQKRLFVSNKLDFTSPVSCSFPLSSPAFDQDDDSPYLYEIRKKEVSTSSQRTINETPLKRSGISAKQRVCLSSSIMEISDVKEHNDEGFIDNSDYDMTSMEVEDEEAISGDFSQICSLPVVKGKHPELNTITPETVASLLVTDHDYDVTIIDCRYPYEFSAGHIKSAVNMYLKESVEEDFFNSDITAQCTKSERLLLFYCEFSSERAPNMMRFIRKRDRSLNEDAYPFVYYPEMYLIDGGYKSFFANFKDLCEPQSYKPMLDKGSSKEFAYYRSLCKCSNVKLLKDEKS